ncbi:19956_t:CDS:2 [Funneliformis geosporum]|nr:19956_t:CDS:2 [Funneliformis geosporum]
MDFTANIDSTTSNELNLNLLNSSMNNMNITNELSSRMQSHHNAFISEGALKSNRITNTKKYENDISKSSTIQNWITGFSRKWKEIMAMRELEAREIV